MLVHRNIYHVPELLQKSVVTMGNFDGVHCGHQAVIKQSKAYAVAHGLGLTVLTFHPHPRLFFYPDGAPFLLTTLDEKIEHLESLGVEGIIALNIKNIHSMGAMQFIYTVLIESIKVNTLFVGYNFYFGENREGNTETLQRYQQFKTVVIPPYFSVSNEPFSSSVIRDHIRQGRIKQARQLLGRPFEVCGVVEREKQLATVLGFPTANIALDKHVVRPKHGVYAVRVLILEDKATQCFYGVANFGLRPTTHNKSSKTVFEVHIFGFSGCLYGRILRIALIRFIREEKVFESVQALKTQIARDCLLAKRIHAADRA